MYLYKMFIKSFYDIILINKILQNAIFIAQISNLYTYKYITLNSLI